MTTVANTTVTTVQYCQFALINSVCYVNIATHVCPPTPIESEVYLKRLYSLILFFTDVVISYSDGWDGPP